MNKDIKANYDYFENIKPNTQLRKHAEEILELAEAIEEGDREHIVEEMADVMLTQLYERQRIGEIMEKYNISVDEVERVIKYKVNRTTNRRRGGYYENRG